MSGDAPRKSAAATRAASALALAALALCGCGSAAQPEAVTFVREHGAALKRTGEAVVEAEQRLQVLPQPPGAKDLTRLRRTARIARERINELRLGLPSFEAAEEEVPLAESEVGAATLELNHALGELVIYARHLRPATLARYRYYMRRGREQWNNALVQMWRVAKARQPPTI